MVGLLLAVMVYLNTVDDTRVVARSAQSPPSLENQRSAGGGSAGASAAGNSFADMPDEIHLDGDTRHNQQQHDAAGGGHVAGAVPTVVVTAPPITPEPQLPTAAVIAGSRPAFMSLPELTSEFPVVDAGTRMLDADRTVQVLEARVPFYVIVLNDMRFLEDMMRKVGLARIKISANATRLVEARYAPILVDGTECTRRIRVVQPSSKVFESHAERAESLDCDKYMRLVQTLKFDVRMQVINTGPAPAFGAARNIVQQDAVERRGVPRYVCAHSDAVFKTVKPLERMLSVAVLFRRPFSAVYTVYDVAAVYDGLSLEQQVGSWEPYLWHFGDNDYYNRARKAGLMTGELGPEGVEHGGGGSTTVIKDSDKGPSAAKQRALGKARAMLYEQYYKLRRDMLDLESDTHAPPVTRFKIELTLADCNKARLHTIVEYISARIGAWTTPHDAALDPAMLCRVSLGGPPKVKVDEFLVYRVLREAREKFLLVGSRFEACRSNCD